MRIRPFYLLAAGIVAFSLAVLIFFVYLMGVRTAYKSLCTEINDAILAASPEDCTVEQGGQVWQADRALLDRYDRFLLLPHVWAVRREQVSPTADSIVLRIGTAALTLTELENGDVNLLWDTGAERRGFTINAGPAAFAQLRSYLRSAAKQTKSP